MGKQVSYFAIISDYKPGTKKGTKTDIKSVASSCKEIDHAS